MFGFFKKDYRYHLEKGEKYLQQSRYVDAKYSFNNALESTDKTTSEGQAVERELLTKLATINNALAELNLKEAGYAIDCGNQSKAEEHLQIVLELAEDVTFREKAEKLLNQLTTNNKDQHIHGTHKSGCAGCSSSHTGNASTSIDTIGADEHLSADEKFELLVSTLPQPLPQRYAALGREFAYSYVAIHDGMDGKALKLLEQMAAETESDIICYELGLIKFRQNDAANCERYLRKAIEINPDNPLCYLALVQLLVEKVRAPEAIPLLNHMIDSDLLAGQAHLMLADVYSVMGQENKSLDVLSKALKIPGMARPAAEMLMPILLGQGRLEEAEFLKKTYLGKCC